jgi:hypothetical protein
MNGSRAGRRGYGLGRRAPAPAVAMPISAMIGPRTDQVVVLLIGLPPTTPNPCSANSTPKAVTAMPTISRMMRPIPRH